MDKVDSIPSYYKNQSTTPSIHTSMGFFSFIGRLPLSRMARICATQARTPTRLP